MNLEAAPKGHDLGDEGFEIIEVRDGGGRDRLLTDQILGFLAQGNPGAHETGNRLGIVADLLTDGPLTTIRVCEGRSCGWLFLDTSRNRTRRWCDMKICGNRAKARRYRSSFL